MFELPTVLTASSLLDKAFGRAAKVTGKGMDRASRARNTAAARVKAAADQIESSLRGYVKGFPSLDRLPAFYRELVDILVDRGKLKKHLGAADWAADKSREMQRAYARRIGNASPKEVPALRREAYGRLASLVTQIEGDLEALIEARRALRRLPVVDPEVPTIVVAGFPNVGKSSFVRAVSSGRPKIADYPFTTKGVTLGHFARGPRRYQVLDTPGLLDRPMERRNPLERQAIAALAHLAHGVLFLLDPSETCGYAMADQLRLLDEVRSLFPTVPIVAAENKADLRLPPSDRPKLSALHGHGAREALDLLLEKLTSRGPAAAPRAAGP